MRDPHEEQGQTRVDQNRQVNERKPRPPSGRPSRSDHLDATSYSTSTPRGRIDEHSASRRQAGFARAWRSSVADPSVPLGPRGVKHCRPERGSAGRRSSESHIKPLGDSARRPRPPARPRRRPPPRRHSLSGEADPKLLNDEPVDAHVVAPRCGVPHPGHTDLYCVKP